MKSTFPKVAAVCSLALVWSSLTSLGVAQTRDEKVLSDRDRFSESDTWIYNDLETARTEASLQKKPMLVLFRCIP